MKNQIKIYLLTQNNAKQDIKAGEPALTDAPKNKTSVITTTTTKQTTTKLCQCRIGTHQIQQENQEIENYV